MVTSDLRVAEQGLRCWGWGCGERSIRSLSGRLVGGGWGFSGHTLLSPGLWACDLLTATSQWRLKAGSQSPGFGRLVTPPSPGWAWAVGPQSRQVGTWPQEPGLVKRGPVGGSGGADASLGRRRQSVPRAPPRPTTPHPCPRCLRPESSAFARVGVTRAAARARVVRDGPAARGEAEPRAWAAGPGGPRQVMAGRALG